MENADGSAIPVLADGSLTGVPYLVPPVDTDQDGIANHLDLDSDGDGLTDAFEGNFQVDDPDNDGRVGLGIPSDADMDGIPDTNDPDDPANVIGGFGFNQDRDGDGVQNYLDLDIDNDGIVDNIEGQATFTYQAPSGVDANMNGLDDQYDVSVGGSAIGFINSDGGSSPDYADTNSDADGAAADPFDLEENGVPGTTPATDGTLDISGGFNDADGDGLADVFDNIAGFGTANNANNNQGPFDFPGPPGQERDWRSAGDNDGDGVADVDDLDDDNDGILDSIEGETIDSDGDGSPDSRDLDADGDGIPDITEVGGNDPDGDGEPGVGPVTVDANGVPIGAIYMVIDTDGDGIENYEDRDSDNDGIPDAVEAGGTDENGDGLLGPGQANDSDSDGLADSVDPLDDRDDSAGDGTPLTLPNTDGNGPPDYLDLDSDDDGILDVVEAGIPDPDNNGLVGSGAGTAIPDTDNDGLADSIDPRDDANAVAGTGTPFSLTDTDEDGFPDFRDLDSDDDGLLDNLEAQPSTTDPLIVAVGTDDDGDGIDNAFDPSPDFGGVGAGLTPEDTDTDDTPDYVDTDSDNDGIEDVVESGLGAPSGADANMDGLDDAYPTTQSFALLANNDLPGTPEFDFREAGKDTDGDGVEDAVDQCPNSLAGATVDANGCTDDDMDGYFSDVDMANPLFDPEDTQACIPDTMATACILVDADGDGFYENVATDNGAFDVDDTDPCVPDDNSPACDDDGDGVPNGTDECPNTLAGATVNATGCTDDDMDGFFPDALAGAPTFDPDDTAPCIPDDTVVACDTDGDGVSDGNDTCPTSAAGATVNAAGCTDDDNDGFFPDIAIGDPSFDPDDAEACIPDASADLCIPVDMDGDGFFANVPTDDPTYDPDDALPCVPDNTAMACDTDGDGVADGNDLCSTTAAGLTVNADGCPDADGDMSFPYDDVNLAGYDPDDTLPCVPDDTVAACDTDGDGVPDGNDTCPTSVAGAVVDANGCTDFDMDGFFPDAPVGSPLVDNDDGNVCIPDPNNVLCDTDNDGVPDGMDICMSPPGANALPGFDVATGCLDADQDGFYPNNNTVADRDPDDDNACVPNSSAATCTPIDNDGDGFFSNLSPTDPTYDPDDNDGCNPDPNSLACDTDGDGVADVNDLCPNSSPGASTSPGFDAATGCTDADGDGFFEDALVSDTDRYDPDDDDICIPNDLDTDGDGFCDLLEQDQGSDPNDPCSPDPNVLACDTDGDGVPDGLDACPNTMAGATVTATGCTDDDGDGFFPDVDPADPTFDVADDNGCIPDPSSIRCNPLDEDGDGYFTNYPAGDPLFDPDDALPCVPDNTVAACDSDMDGVPDGLDNCLLTAVGATVNAEGCTDTDGDEFFPDVPATAANFDPDDTDGCVPNPDADACDTDGDGVPDNVDTCPNSLLGAVVNAAGCTDADMDGFFGDITVGDPAYDPDDFEACIPNRSSANCTPIDDDGDGFFSNIPATESDFDLDDNNGCIPDPMSGGCDADEDGVFADVDPNDMDPCDPSPLAENCDITADDDGDGVPNLVELAEATDPNDPLSFLDTDGDDIPDFSDPDADEDGVPDLQEFGGNPYVDVDMDGVPAYLDPDDTDGDVGAAAGAVNGDFDSNVDGNAEFQDPNSDTDGDGVPDGVETAENTDPLDSTDFQDTDNDGEPDFTETDSDDDGLDNVAEAGGDPYADNDSDGVPAYLDDNDDNPIVRNEDDAIEDEFDDNNNGVADFLEERPDNDNDGVPDDVDACPNSAPGATVDAQGCTDDDGDGFFPDAPPVAATFDRNDNNGCIPDPSSLACDSDGDGVPDVNDTCPNSLAGAMVNAAGCTDDDMDGFFPDIAMGDPSFDPNDNEACLPDASAATCTPIDDDGDGFFANVDPSEPTYDPNDADGCVPDPTGGACDADMDGTFADVDPDDADPCVPSPLAGACDILTDSDGDGVPDLTEQAEGTDPNDSDSFLDFDMDGTPDYVDDDSDNDGVDDEDETPAGDPYADNDGDGVPAYLDDDDDNGTVGNDDGQVETPFDENGDNIADSNDPNNDSDGDDVPNGVETAEGTTPLDVNDFLDTDEDGTPDFADTDADNDGINSNNEGGGDPYLDNDGDGVPIYLDGDDNDFTVGNEGVQPIYDADLDGIIDVRDGDSDNDGLTDAREAYEGNPDFGDTDNDGKLDRLDGAPLTSGADGTIDGVDYTLPRKDTDGDQIPNYRDLDSDGDGLPDAFEGNFQVSDPDNDGRVGEGIAPDSDGDGIADSNDPDSPANVLNGFGFDQDRDGDGVKNYLDIDTDNDGIVDNIEGQSTFSYFVPSGVDANGNGLDDQYDVSAGGLPIGYTNSDGGGAPDYVDTNSDTESADNAVEPFDIEENGVAGAPFTSAGILDISGGFNDADGDGLADIFDQVAGFETAENANNGQTPADLPGPVGEERDFRDSGDHDGDGVADVDDLDDDNDGIPDLVEDPTGANVDRDGDGLPDSRDLDSDGDGIPDVTEAGGNDPDGDGFPGTGAPIGDPVTGVPPGAMYVELDTDGDGIENYKDRDSDNDGITDAVEAGGTDPNGDGILGAGISNDSDADGLADAVDTYNNVTEMADDGTPLPLVNTDGNGPVDYLDLDSDDDGILDVREAGSPDGDNNGLVGTGVGTGIADADGDGLADAVDPVNNLTGVAGTGEIDPVADADGDGLADYIDIDSDNDGLVDYLEAQLTAAAPYLTPSAVDGDGDGIVDSFDDNAGFGGTGLTPRGYRFR